MSDAIVFFGVATFLSALYRVMGEVRIRLVTRRLDSNPDEVLELARANYITSVGFVTSATGFILVVFAAVVVR